MIAHTTFRSVVDITAIQIAPANDTSSCDLLNGQLSESQLCGKLLIQSIQIAMHVLLDFTLRIDPVRMGNICWRVVAVCRQGFSTHKAAFDTSSYNFLKHLLNQVALLPLPHAHFTKCGVIWYRFMQFKAANPTIPKTQTHFINLSAFRFDPI